MSEAATVRLVSGQASDDAALVEAFRRGDRGAFETLVRRHQKVLRVCQDRVAAEDIAQRAFLTAYERIGELRGSFRPWLLRIAANLAKNHRRDGGRLVPTETLPEDIDHESHPDERLDEARRGQQLREAVLALPDRQREVVTLRIDGQLPFAEIAEALGITENNAKVTFHVATKKLRERLGGTDAGL